MPSIRELVLLSRAYNQEPTAFEGAVPLISGLAVGTAAALLWKKHRVLGFLSGVSVGRCVYPLYKGLGHDRLSAVTQIGGAAAAAGLSLYWKKHPALGYLSGAALGFGAEVAVSLTDAQSRIPLPAGTKEPMQLRNKSQII